MRRSDFDVTDTIRTTRPDIVRSEVMRLYRNLYDGAASQTIEQAFDDTERLYAGEHPDFYPCDTEYHDVQHVMDVTLAMARLMDGYQRARSSSGCRIPAEIFTLGVIGALFHDFGYLRRRTDTRHRYGAEYTLKHVSRGVAFLRHYLRRLGIADRLADLAATLVHFTGYERPTESIRISDSLLRRIGHMLGTADIVAQMADRCYLEKCRDRLYPEFVLGGLTRRVMPGGRSMVMFSSGDDLVRKTPGFYQNAAKRLDIQLARAYVYAEDHFGGQNLYVEEMCKNVRHAETVAGTHDGSILRRDPPNTLPPGVLPYPRDLMSA